eukprot:Awhi_evm1s14018
MSMMIMILCCQEYEYDNDDDDDDDDDCGVMVMDSYGWLYYGYDSRLLNKPQLETDSLCNFLYNGKEGVSPSRYSLTPTRTPPITQSADGHHHHYHPPKSPSPFIEHMNDNNSINDHQDKDTQHQHQDQNDSSNLSKGYLNHNQTLSHRKHSNDNNDNNNTNLDNAGNGHTNNSLSSTIAPIAIPKSDKKKNLDYRDSVLSSNSLSVVLSGSTYGGSPEPYNTATSATNEIIADIASNSNDINNHNPNHSYNDTTGVTSKHDAAEYELQMRNGRYSYSSYQSNATESDTLPFSDESDQ